MGFLRELLRPRDRAFIEIFSDQANVLASFTADFPTLENALLSLFADRATALYDSAIMGLFQFSGVRGRRAIVILTDGEDTTSRTGWKAAERYAHTMRIPVFPIGLGLGKMDFAMMAQSMGVPGARVRSVVEFETAMDTAMDTDGPYLIDVDMEHFEPMEISVMPKKK